MEENYQLLSQLAQQLSYKPGHTFLIRRVDNDTALVSLRCPSLPDSYGSDSLVGLTINNTVKLSTIVTLSDALQAFASVVADFELHEAAEFFKHNRRSVFLPHAWGDELGGFTWEDFINLNGKYLRALKNFLGKHEPSRIESDEGTKPS